MICKYKHILIVVIFVFIVVWCWGASICCGDKLVNYYDSISMKLEKDPLETADVDRIINYELEFYSGENILITAWTQKNEQEIINTDMNYSIYDDVVFMYGQNTEKIGLYAKGDCVVSKDKAYEIWKSTDVCGKDVIIDKIKYTISKVIDEDIGLISVMVKNNEDIYFDVLDINYQNSENKNWIADEFASRNGIEFDMVADYSTISVYLSKITMMPLLVLGFFILANIACVAYDNRNNMVIFIGMMIVTVISAAVLWKVIGFSIEIPARFVPTKWSDFEFWQKSMDVLKSDLNNFKAMKLYIPDIYFREVGIKALICSIISSAVLLAGMINFKKKGN